MTEKGKNFINLLKKSKLEDTENLIYKVKCDIGNRDLLEDILKETGLLDFEFEIQEKDNWIFFKLDESNFFEEVKCHYFLNKEKFLTYFKLKKLNLDKDEDNFYIEELKICSKTDKEKIENEDFFKSYFVLSKIRILFENIKDDFNSIEEAYILHFQDSFRIRKTIDLQTIENFKNESKRAKLEQILNKLISDTTNKEQKLSDANINKNFLKKAIRDNIKTYLIENKASLSEVINNIESIFDDYELLKKAYIDSLDPDTIKEKFLSKYTDILNFLKSLLSDLHTKLLFAPLTAIFAIAQKAYKTNISDKQNIENISNASSMEILLGIILIIFLVILGIFIKGYFSILRNIKLQIDTLEGEVEREKNKSNTNFWEDIDKKLKNVKHLYKSVRNRIWFVYVIIILSSIVIIVTLICPINLTNLAKFILS